MKKTTLNLDETVMARLKEEATRRKTTMGALVEAGVRRMLAEDEAPAPPPVDLLPLPAWNGGEPLVDIDDREALYEALDRERDERLSGVEPAPGLEEILYVQQPGMRAVAEDPAPYDAGGPPHATAEGADEA